MNTDLSYIIHWWLLLFLFGICFLPITLRIFSTFFDKGYIFSKLIGLALVSYLIFLFGTLHITPFTQTTIIELFVICAVGNGILFFKKDLLQLFAKKRKLFLIFLFEELVFFFSLNLWAYIRGFTPDIHELEKFMDFGFVNSILRSTYFPPKDMWFTPFPINYYYFGHFVTAMLTKLSGISSNITFNLMLATIFAFCFTCSFSLGANLWYLLRGNPEQKTPGKQGLLVFFTGLLSAILLTFGGNLHIIYTFFKSYGNDNPVPPWQLPFLPGSFLTNGYWYPDATRFIYHTIHEFPIYSFVVSDLHGHVLDIPFVLLTIAVLLAFFSNFHLKKLITTKYFLLNIIFVGFLLAIMYMTNAWDGLMYFLLSIIVFAVIIKQTKQVFFFDNIFLEIISLLVSIVASAYIFSRPFAIFFNVGEIAHGIGILCAPKFLTDKQQIGPFLFEANHCQHSLWWQLLILYGFFYIWAIPFIIFLWKKWKKNTYTDLRIAPHKKEQTTALKTKTYTIAKSDMFVLLLILFATFLIIIPEFFYLKDIYPDHYRANTMFKLVYQAFMMLSLASGYIIVRFFIFLKSQKQIAKRIIFTTLYSLFAIFLLVLVAGLYPYFAISSYYGNLQTYHSLDGTAYLKGLYPTDYAAINWINKNITGQPVILEAQGDSYTDYARVSSNTGLPTVLGWTVHEWLWRGTYDVPAPRITDVQTLYETNDIATAETLIKKYNIQYIFIGDMERKKYTHLQIDKFNKLGKIIYKNGSTMIYKTTI